MSQRNLLAKYIVLEDISEGGYGLVSKGKERCPNGKEVAIKRLRRSSYKKEDQFRLQVELEISKLVQHNNIIRCLNIFSEIGDDEVYLVMELARGGEVFEALMRIGRFPENTSATIIKHLLNALEYLHDLKIVYRDVKPENMLLKYPLETGKIHVLLCDFGLAAIKGREVIRGSFGSMYYIAPEALGSKMYDEKVDMWAVGVVAYALMAGFPPFCTDSDNQQEVMKLVEKAQYEYTETLWKNISREAKTFVDAHLNLAPTMRPTAKESKKLKWIETKAM